MYSDPSYMPYRNFTQLHISNDSTIKYLQNADFQLWFRPVVKRIAIGLMLVAPGLFLLAYCHLLTPFLGLMVHYLRIFRPFLTSAGSPEAAYWIGFLSAFSGPVFTTAGIGVAWLTIKMTREADLICMGQNSLFLARTVNRGRDYSVVRIRDIIDFDQVAEIEIVRPANTRSNLDYCFVLRRSNGPPFKVRFGDIINADDRNAFINVLKNRFPRYVNDEAIAAFAPPRDRQSYTELWIAELSAPPKRDRLTPLETGTYLFDRKYQVVNRLGVGGQGTVYLAACGLEEVVLKEFVLPVFPDTRVRKAAAVRFQEEANLLTKLDHLQIVKLKDLFLEDHRAYLVLEHLPGKNLKDLILEQGALPQAEVIKLGKQMCEILAYLHGQQPPVVHRDFTPDNLILDEDGKIKLIDFSVAQSFTSNVTGSVVGKPNYIAPEQFRGKPVWQSDIYSMGATLYYLVTGADPEPITNLRLKDAKADADPKLAKIIERATKLDVRDRYQSANEVLEQLSL